MMHKSILTAVALLGCFATSSAVGGIITIDIDANRSMYFATIRTNHAIESHYLTDSDGDGKIEVTVANQETVKEYWVTKPFNERLMRYTIKSTASLLKELEPFELPSFEPVGQDVSLFLEFDIDESTDFGSLFSPGDVLTSTGGSISSMSQITVRVAPDAPSALPDATLYDPSLLPLYTGELRVGAFDAYDPPVVPAPASLCLGLLGMGIAGVATGHRRSKLRGARETTRQRQAL